MDQEKLDQMRAILQKLEDIKNRKALSTKLTM